MGVLCGSLIIRHHYSLCSVKVKSHLESVKSWTNHPCDRHCPCDLRQSFGGTSFAGHAGRFAAANDNFDHEAIMTTLSDHLTSQTSQHLHKTLNRRQQQRRIANMGMI